jgi:hypothetical protein
MRQFLFFRDLASMRLLTAGRVFHFSPWYSVRTMADEARRLRAQERSGRVTLRRTNLDDTGSDVASCNGSEAVALAFKLTKYSWEVAGLAMPNYTRATIPIRFVPRKNA